MKESAFKAYKNNDVLKNELSAAYHILRVQPNRKYSRRRRLTDLTWLVVIVWWHIRQHPHFPPFRLTFVVSSCQSFGMQAENGEEGCSRKGLNTTSFGMKCCYQNTTQADVIWGRLLWRCGIDSRRLKKNSKFRRCEFTRKPELCEKIWNDYEHTRVKQYTQTKENKVWSWYLLSVCVCLLSYWQQRHHTTAAAFV